MMQHTKPFKFQPRYLPGFVAQEGKSKELGKIIDQMKSHGCSKERIILQLWGVSKGGSPKYKAAEAEYKRLVEE
jgi:hypothetical protein